MIPSHSQTTQSTAEPAAEPTAGRSTAWRYYVCGLLLLATTINYLDRQTLSNTKSRILTELKLGNEQYGDLEFAFGLAFAVGALGFGFIADRVNVYWLYPAVLVLWSMVGYCTGLVETFAGLLFCRTLLGLFEAGHWPCALKTTQRILSPRRRTLGNSILQSGSSIGSIVTPLLVLAMLTPERGSWRPIFQIIGLVGMGWVVLWFTAVRAKDLAPDVGADDGRSTGPSPTPPADSPDEPSFWRVVFSRRFAILLVLVMSINICWHLFRAWLPTFLENGRGYTYEESLSFVPVFYIATDVGCIAAGLISIWLTRVGWSVHRARTAVFTGCAVLTSATVVIPLLPAGWVLLDVLLVVACGSLGLFPCYYSFSQELSVKHQGKITGLLGTFAWASAAPVHKYFGRYIDQTGSYDLGMALAGVFPLVGAVVLLLAWNRRSSPQT